MRDAQQARGSAYIIVQIEVGWFDPTTTAVEFNQEKEIGSARNKTFGRRASQAQHKSKGAAVCMGIFVCGTVVVLSTGTER